MKRPTALYPINDMKNYTTTRLIYRVLVMHYLEGLKQSEIATKTGLSTAKVNRLIKQGKDDGMLEISINSPLQPLLDLEAELVEIGGISQAVLIPTMSDNPDLVGQAVGAAAANHLLETIKDGDTIAITGGKGVRSVIDGLSPERSYDVEIVPLIGLVQGLHYTDVNHAAGRMAEKLGGISFPIHAPLFADDAAQRDMLLSMNTVTQSFERARKADVSIYGIGSVLSADSSYYDLHPRPKGDQEALRHSRAVAELLGQLLDVNGNSVDYALNARLVALTFEELRRIPVAIGVAFGEAKQAPICSALRGQLIKTLVTDEQTARGVISMLKKRK